MRSMPSLILLLLAAAGMPATGKKQSDGWSSFKKPPGKLPLPITWFHCPKCGTDFMNVWTHAEGVCPGIDPNAFGSQDQGRAGDNDPFVAYIEDNKLPTICTGLANSDAFGLEWGLGTRFIKDAGNYIGIFRQPEQRLLSAYYDWTHNRYRKGQSSFNPGRSWAWWFEEDPKDLHEYLRTNAGCQTRLMTREGFVCGDPTKPTPEEQALAVERVRNFTFIGLTEEWSLTVCLWHAMFGGQCHSLEFVNGREGPGPKEANSQYDVAELRGEVDPWDGKVYAEAKDFFHRKLQEYGVSHESCQPCYASSLSTPTLSPQSVAVESAVEAAVPLEQLH